MNASITIGACADCKSDVTAIVGMPDTGKTPARSWVPVWNETAHDIDGQPIKKDEWAQNDVLGMKLRGWRVEKREGWLGRGGVMW